MDHLAGDLGRRRLFISGENNNGKAADYRIAKGY